MLVDKRVVGQVVAHVIAGGQSNQMPNLYIQGDSGDAEEKALDVFGYKCLVL